MYCQHTPTWTTKPLTQLGRITKCPRHIPQPAKNKFTYMHMRNYLHVCVSKCRWRGADPKVYLLHITFNPAFPCSLPYTFLALTQGLIQSGKNRRFLSSDFLGQCCMAQLSLPFECQIQQLPWRYLPQGATLTPDGQSVTIKVLLQM